MIKAQKKITFVNDCGAIFDDSELEKAILWFQESPTLSIKHVYMFGEYPAISICERKLHIHRLLMSYWMGAKIPPEFTVHHLDKNKLNASKDNLAILYAPKHQSIHNKNKTLSAEQRQKISEKNHLRKGTKHKPTRPDVTPEKVISMFNGGKTINQISRELNIDWGCVKQRIHDNPELLKEAK